MKGPTSSRGSRNRLICLTLQEHDDDDDDDEIYIYVDKTGLVRFFKPQVNVVEIMCSAPTSN